MKTMDPNPEDDYTPPWRVGDVPTLNDHLPQLKPRQDVRPAALDELVERRKNAPKAIKSGHSLIR